MTKTLRKTLCFVIVLIVLSTQSGVRARQDDDNLGCSDDDTECLIDAISDSIAFGRRLIDASQQAFQPWLEYNSKLFNVDWKIDQNGLAVFRSLYPRLLKLIEDNLASRYGIVLPSPPSQSKPSGGGFGATPFNIMSLYIGVSLALGTAWDSDHNGPAIDRMVQDFESHGWDHDTAVKEANYQFMSHIGPRDAAFANILTGGLGGLATTYATIKRLLNILSSGRYYGLWASNRRAQIREMIEQQNAGRRGPDNGRSYMQWAAQREGSLGGGSSDCIAWFWVPAHDEWDPITATLTHHDGHWECIKG